VKRYFSEVNKIELLLIHNKIGLYSSFSCSKRIGDIISLILLISDKTGIFIKKFLLFA
jgi:hypothetical protein